MSGTGQELETEFDRRLPQLTKGLSDWFVEETKPIDDGILTAIPSGTGGSILDVKPAIDSKRVLDATIVTEEVLGIKLPPAIIRPGGYGDLEAMLNDIVPQLRRLFIGEPIVKRAKGKGNDGGNDAR